ncbi:MAG: septal ring lytic transglycosylase RlpA family protein [Desulfovibrio sp.]|nr:septal ring lytic transglycosylase RlpA family protein [Desulfovibrio sp.]
MTALLPGFFMQDSVQTRRRLLFCWLFLFALSSPALAAEHALEGTASWYGTSAHGKPTATGERFNRAAPTAAHRTLPFGTIVRVRNLANDRRALVRINDRGPFLPSRMLDVSLHTARSLQMQEAGLAPVALEIVSKDTGRPLDLRNSFFLFLSEAQTPQEAHASSARLHQAVKLPIRAFFSAGDPQTSFTLCLGPYATFREAEAVFLSLHPLPLAIMEAPTSPAPLSFLRSGP